MSMRAENHLEHSESINEKFKIFLDAHPDAYPRFCKVAAQLRGRTKHCSADMVLHVMRFFSMVDGRPEEDYKINNNYSALFARMWQKDNPEDADFFETRVRRSA